MVRQQQTLVLCPCAACGTFMYPMDNILHQNNILVNHTDVEIGEHSTYGLTFIFLGSDPAHAITQSHHKKSYKTKRRHSSPTRGVNVFLSF